MSDVTIPQTFDLAVQHHKAGRLQQAEQLYRQVLAQQPEHAHATFYLGKIAHQTGHIDIALDLIRKSIALDPNFAEAHYTLGKILTRPKPLTISEAPWRAMGRSRNPSPRLAARLPSIPTMPTP